VTGVATDRRYIEENFRFANLKLVELNFRTAVVDSQRAAIRAMIDEQGDALVALAVICLELGLDIGYFLLVIAVVVFCVAFSFVVLVGIRRMWVLKLL
jgi:hypothetical protein